MPGDGLTHGPPATKNAGGSHHRWCRSTGIPCAMVYGLYRDLLGDRAFLPPSSLRSLLLKNLTSASGGRDHATSPSAKGHVRLTCHPRPSHPRPTCRDDRAYVPLHRGGMGGKMVLICPTPQARTHVADRHDGQFPHGAHAGNACRPSECTSNSAAVTANAPS